MTELAPRFTHRASDGVTLSYRAIGEGAPVVLVHGWMASGGVFDSIIDRFPGRRLIVPDLRGAGMSQRAVPDSLARLATDVLEIANAANAQDFELVGHSMGGQIATLVAVSAPSRVRSLALLCPVPLAGIALPPDADGLFRSAGGDANKLGTILDLACKQLTPEAKRALVDEALTIAPESIARVYELWSKGVDADLSGLDVPTLVVATDDPFTPPAMLNPQVVDRIAGARLAVLRGPGHYPTVERPAETAALLTEFWDKRA